MDTRQPEKSYLFLLRVWEGDTTDEAGEPKRQWQGKIHQVLGGKSGYLADISMLVELVRSMLPSEDTGEEPSE